MDTDTEISFLVFMGVVGFILAMKTTEAPWWFLLYTVGSSACFGVAVKLVLER